MKLLKLLPALFMLAILSSGARAELQDQGLNSILVIIDKAIEELGTQTGGDAEADSAAVANATAAIVNLSRTLGTLSYSRLQCGEAGVLAEFTQRVQRMPEESRDPMRDAFQEGFDKSKEETPLLSQDECERLTRSRNRADKETEANVKEDTSKQRAAAEPVAAEKPKEVAPEEDPRLRHLRIAEISGQLAYRRRFCEDEKVFNRDYNEYLESVPAEYREEVKEAYWRGYQHGKRLNRSLTREQCPSRG